MPRRSRSRYMFSISSSDSFSLFLIIAVTGGNLTISSKENGGSCHDPGLSAFPSGDWAAAFAVILLLVAVMPESCGPCNKNA